MSNTYQEDKLEIMKLLIPAVTQDTSIEFVKKILGLSEADEYNPVYDWPRYVAVRCGQMADEILDVAYSDR